jgi:hypothetical protein
MISNPCVIAGAKKLVRETQSQLRTSGRLRCANEKPVLTIAPPIEVTMLSYLSGL